MDTHVAQSMATNIEPFLLNPMHRKFLLGKSKSLSGQSVIYKALVVLAIGLTVVLFILAPIISLWDTYVWYRVEHSGVSTKGLVVDRRIDDSRDEEDI